MSETLDPAGGGGGGAGRRAEVDTSAPFESVRAAVDRFGGSAVWKLQLKQLFVPEKHHPFEELEEHMRVGEQTKLEMDLMVKERETFEVLKELEKTKKIVDELKMKLQKDTSEAVNTQGTCSDNVMLHPILDTKEQPRNPNDNVESVGLSILVKQSPGLILMELKQAKLNLNRTTNDLASIRASIELLNSRIKEERALLEITHERLSLNTMKASALEEEINRKKVELLQTSSLDIPSQIEQLNSQKERFMKITKTSEAEISKLTAEIKERTSNIKAAEIRCLVAKKMEEAAKVAEAIALSKIAALTNNKDPVVCKDSSKVVLSVEEYDILTRTAQEADELSKKKIEAAMLQVEEANRSKEDLLLKVEEAIADVETSKKALEEALNREETANQEKLVVEAGLRKWRSEHGQKRRSSNNSTKFKNSCTSHQRRDSRMLDVNGLSMNASGSRSPLRPTLSIGQILSRKLTGPEDYEATPEIVTGKPKVSLGQILSGRHGSLSPQSTDDGINHKQLSAKRKKLGFTGFSLQLTAKNKKSKKRKKRQTRNPVNCRPKLVSLLV